MQLLVPFSIAKKMARSLLARRGWALVRKSQYGYDPYVDITRLTEQWGGPVEIFFDIGANEGQTATEALRMFPAARVFSFEPHPITFQTLKSRFGNNSRVVCYNIALSDGNNNAVMYEYSESKINSLTSKARYAVRQEKKVIGEVPVKIASLDCFCRDQNIDRIDVLKIDTEGHELEVLKGAVNLLSSRKIRYVYAEFNELLPINGVIGGALCPIAEIIYPFGYRFIATYNDNLHLDGDLLGISNVLFALPPQRLDALIGSKYD
jgi:FkbM family methyltransferase